jgi:hypothetical protein
MIVSLTATLVAVAIPQNTAASKVLAVSFTGTNNLTLTTGTGVSVPNGSTVSAAYTGTLIAQTATTFTIVYPTGATSVGAVDGSVAGTVVSFGTSANIENSLGFINQNTLVNLGSGVFHYIYQLVNTSYITGVTAQDSAGTITSGASVTTPSTATGSIGGSSISSVVKLDSTHIAISYRDTTAGNRLTAVVGVISGTTITYGTPAVLSSSTATSFQTTASTSITGGFVTTYKDTTNSNKLTAVACSVSGTTITPDVPVVLSNTTNVGSVFSLDSTHFLTIYTDSTNSNALTGLVCSVSGTTITLGTAQVISASTDTVGTRIGTVAVLDSTHFAVAYLDTVTNSYTSVVVCSVSGTTITVGVPVNTGNGGTTGSNDGLPQIIPLGSTNFVLAYYDTITNSLLNNKTLVLTTGFISGGTTVTLGSQTIITNAATVVEFLLQSLDSTNFIFAFKDQAIGDKLKVLGGTLSGTNNLTATLSVPIIVGTVVSGITPTVIQHYFITTDTTHFLFVLTDVSTAVGVSTQSSNRFRAVYGSYSNGIISTGTPITLSYTATGGATNLIFSLTPMDSTHVFINYLNSFNASRMASKIITANTSVGNLIGFALNSASAGNPVLVVSKGIITGLSSLTPGAIYYAASDGSISTTHSSLQVGLALSATTLLIKANDTNNNTNIGQFFG